MKTLKLVLALSMLAIGTAGFLIALPKYKVWEKQLAGEAVLKEAEYTRLIIVEEASADLKAAKIQAQARIEEAKGIAQAAKIIGESLASNPSFLQYYWLQGLQDEHTEVVYVPTEKGLPLLMQPRSK